VRSQRVATDAVLGFEDDNALVIEVREQGQLLGHVVPVWVTWQLVAHVPAILTRPPVAPDDDAATAPRR
jgi:hypothetical protein